MYFILLDREDNCGIWIINRWGNDADMCTIETVKNIMKRHIYKKMIENITEKVDESFKIAITISLYFYIDAFWIN